MQTKQIFCIFPYSTHIKKKILLKHVEKVIKAHKDPTTGVALDTLAKKKQALIFCSSKRAAESQAEKISKTIKEDVLIELSEKILNALSTPTKQCKRLASIIRKGIAFHHAGLARKQRELIEDHFRAGDISIICSTPTLAAGLDMPAYRAIIRDTKRFGARGMVPIPVLEYEQMSGRAGRPGKEEYGEAILIAGKETDVEYLTDRYIHGDVEDIYSKLAVEPVLRTYVLSLVSTGFIKNTQELYDFFDQTFYAHQYGDTTKLHATLNRMVGLLRRWTFLEASKETVDEPSGFTSGFIVASELENKQSEPLLATPLGKRVSEIYIDPLSAHILISGLHSLSVVTDDAFAFVHLLCCTLELRPLLGVKVNDLELIESLKEQRQRLLDEDEFYKIFQDDYDDTIKTAKFIEDWMQELSEDQLLELYNIRPGEISTKLQTADWLLYACEELARMKQMKPLLKTIKRIRVRVKHGVRSELIPLLAFKGIGRSRARKLFSLGIKDVKGVTDASYEKLTGILGRTLAAQLKEQVGEKVELVEVQPKYKKNTKLRRTTLDEF